MREPADTPRSLEILLLGPFSVVVDGVPVPEDRWQRRQAKTLVKILALSPHLRAHREALTELLWPDADPELAANNLNKVIHAARRALEPSLRRGGDSAFIITREQQVLLDAPGGPRVDALDFERLAAEALERGADAARCEAALALYAGDLLVEDRYDAWLDTRRSRLSGLRHDLADRLAGIYEAWGDLHASLTLLEALVATDPFDEAAVRRLMRVHAASGRRDRALKLFDELAARLRAELDAEPDPATVTVRDELARTEPETEEEPPKPRTNLPRRGTRFVGREREVAEIERSLRDERLVTLTGLGGIGKTRLASHVAASAAPSFPGGVWLVELAGVADPALVGRATVAALGIPERRGLEPAAAIAGALAEPALVVLDNCEHLVEAAAAFASALLSATERITILATSREPLGVEGELVWRVTPLELPPPEAAPSAATLDEFEATRLYLDRARLRSPGFAPSPETSAAVVELCRRLDGVPLAIELAAASAGTLAAASVVARLDDRLRFTASGERSADPRHRTLGAVMDWSYDLLSEPERRLLERLSVFAGGFTLDAAEAIASASAEPFERSSTQDSAPSTQHFESTKHLLERLADTSLVTPEAHGEEVRYHLLETVRLYAAEKLAGRGEEEAVRRSHALWFAGYAESVEPELSGLNQKFAVDRLNDERENLWAAIRWSLEHLGRDDDAAVRLCGALWLWLQRSRLDESRRWFEQVLAVSEGAPTAPRARLLHGLGNFCRQQGDFGVSKSLVERSVAMWRELGDQTNYARTLQTLASLLAEVGDYERGEAYLREAAEICRVTGDLIGYARSANWLGVHAIHVCEFDEAREWLGEALSLYRNAGAEANAMVMVHNLGEVALLTGDLDLADRLAAESLDASRRISETIIAPHSIRLRGDVATRRGDYEGARGLYRQAVEMHRAVGDRPALVGALESLGELAAATGDAEIALRIAGAATAAREQSGIHTHPFERRVLDAWIDRARAAVSPETAARAFDRGRVMPLDVALEVGMDQ